MHCNTTFSNSKYKCVSNDQLARRQTYIVKDENVYCNYAYWLIILKSLMTANEEGKKIYGKLWFQKWEEVKGG